MIACADTSHVIHGRYKYVVGVAAKISAVPPYHGSVLTAMCSYCTAVIERGD